ncbi:epithelial membrane protein 3 isoform X1 [Syngnathus scovelli]|uniref:epithelial membrane protein 3 isoform X1 n=1 Tax=Syngnathus scovelli TaxID=161590 RepID=UPI00210FB5BF|nr:epithelial membrane protein 3 [Syngnathus scovelli]
MGVEYSSYAATHSDSPRKEHKRRITSTLGTKLQSIRENCGLSHGVPPHILDRTASCHPVYAPCGYPGEDWLQSVQALMVLSVVFSSISLLVFAAQLFTMSKGGLFYLTGLCQAFAGFTDFAACLIFTFHRKEILNDSSDLGKGHFGYCFILAWLCVPLLLISGVLYGHLRKKE